MKFLSVLCTLYAGTDGAYSFITTVLATLGLSRLFIKSGVAFWWAFVPCAREYMLAKCAGRETDGRVMSVSVFIYTLANALGLVLSGVHSHLSLALTIVSIVAGLSHLIYALRVYSGLCDMYLVRKRWLWLWMLFDFIPALIWGFDKQYQPAWKVEDIRREKQTFFGGKDVAPMENGLTVNLRERTVTEFFQKKYLLRDIHMNIEPGHMVLLLGGSGAGKTTFLNAVNGYEKARATVTLNGGDVYGDYKKMKYEVGFVPQQELMRGKDTVLHTLMDASRLRLPSEISAADRKARVAEVMDIFGLTPVRSSLVDKLSGGQKKRLSIAMEFISNPSLFILDEPDSGLDGVMARELMQQLRMIADQGKIVIVITHTPDRVIDLFDDVIVLAKDANRTGRLTFFGPIDEARSFFDKSTMEQIVLSINRPEEGGEGRADVFIQRFMEVQHV